MRIGIAGKGGAGKTTTSATLARLFARRGMHVVAVDADSNPNLAPALGLAADDVARLGPLPRDLISRKLRGPALTQPLEQVLADHAASAPDGVRMLMMGMPEHAGEGCLCAGHATVGALLDDLGEQRDTVTVLDLEASPEHLSRGTARYVDTLLLVTEPYYRSLETSRRLAALAAQLPIPHVAVLANKVRSREDGEALHAFCERHGLALAGEVPWSEAVQDADRRAQPVLDADPDGPVVSALAALADRLDARRLAGMA
jgi:CO dehydrogenase maturation factor